MNVLVVASNIISISETFIYNQLEALERNNTCTVLGISRSNESVFDIKSDVVIVPPVPVSFIDKICTKFYREKIGFGNYIYPYLSVKKIEKVIVSKKIDAIHVQYGSEALKMLPIAKKYNIPMYVSFHGFDASQLLNEEVYTEALKSLFGYIDKALLCANEMYSRLEPFGLHKDKVEVVFCGIDTQKLSDISTVNNSGEIIVTHAGRITEKKGVLDLVKVCEELFDEGFEFKLNLVGGGDLFGELEKVVDNSKYKSKINLTGALPHKDLLKIVASSDVYVLNSRTAKNGDKEGLPNTIFEAMLFGKPVLSTIHSGIPEAITTEESGLLVNEYDNSALKQNLIRLVESEELRVKLGKKAKEVATNKFTKRAMIKHLDTIFKNATRR